MIVVVGDPSLRLGGDGVPTVAIGAAVAIARACARVGATVQLAGKIGDDPPGDEILLTLTRDGIGHVALLRDAGTVTLVEATTTAGAATGPAATTAGAATGPAATAVTYAHDGAVPDDDWLVPADDGGDADAGTGSQAPAAEARRLRASASSLAPEDLDLALRYLSSFGVLIVAQPLSPPTLAVAVDSAAFAGAHLILIDAPEEAAAAVAGVPVDDITALESPVTDPEGDFTGLVGRYATALDGGTPAAAAFRTALGAAGWEAVTA